MSDDLCKCSQHGEQPITFVCKHMTGTPRPNTVGFVSYPSEGKDDLRMLGVKNAMHTMSNMVISGSKAP